jgi:hypothetical protein
MSMLLPGYVFDKDCLMSKWVYRELVYEETFPTVPSENTEICFSSLIDRNNDFGIINYAFINISASPH